MPAQLPCPGTSYDVPCLLATGAVPVLGPATQGISSSLGGVSSWLGSAHASARAAARGLGVPGLDVGAGCGVLAGYYVGAGLMLKPSVVQQVKQATTQLAGGSLREVLDGSGVFCGGWFVG